MRTFVALLRGINVGGRNAVPMAELRVLLEEVGLADVRTYIQSGNVLFRADSSPTGLAERIEESIDGAFGVRPAVILRTADELASVVASTPFPDTEHVHVVFLEQAPTSKAGSALDPGRSPPDAFALVGREIYLHLARGAGRSKLTLDYLERTLGVRGTQRNWNTVCKLLALAS